MTLIEAREAMVSIMRQHPGLTADALHQVAVAADHPARRELLSDHQLTGFIEACTWLDKQPRCAAVQQRSLAYRAKHRLEDQIGRYTPLGTFIAACYASDVVVEQRRGSSAVRTNLGAAAIRPASK